MTISQLESQLAQCKTWHSEALKTLSEAGTIEYRRLKDLFQSTEQQLSTIEKAILENRIETRKKIRNTVALGLVAVLAVGAIYGVMSTAAHGVLLLVIAILAYINLVDQFERRIFWALRVATKKDLHALGVSSIEMMQIIEKALRLDEIFEPEAIVGNQLQLATHERQLLRFQIEYRILSRVVEPSVLNTAPTCLLVID